MQHIIDEYKRQSRLYMRECLIRRDYVRNNPDQNIDSDLGKEYWDKAKHYALLAARVCK